MPQLMRVVQCFKCLMFQVDIVKKANKWNCKICGEKQTFQREFGRGSGKECRLHVIQLNEIQKGRDELVADFVENVVNEIAELPETFYNNENQNCVSTKLKSNNNPDSNNKSYNKWESFLEEKDEKEYDNTSNINNSCTNRSSNISIHSKKIMEPERRNLSFIKQNQYNNNVDGKNIHGDANCNQKDTKEVVKGTIIPKPLEFKKLKEIYTKNSTSKKPLPNISRKRKVEKATNCNTEIKAFKLNTHIKSDDNFTHSTTLICDDKDTNNSECNTKHKFGKSSFSKWDSYLESKEYDDDFFNDLI